MINCSCLKAEILFFPPMMCLFYIQCDKSTFPSLGSYSTLSVLELYEIEIKSSLKWW